jgi:hypothetical protein
LQKDLQSTHKTVMEAKQAVMTTAKELNKVRVCAKISTFPSVHPS